MPSTFPIHTGQPTYSGAEHREDQQREVRKNESANENESANGNQSANSNESARLFLMVYRPRVFSGGATAAMWL